MMFTPFTTSALCLTAALAAGCTSSRAPERRVYEDRPQRFHDLGHWSVDQDGGRLTPAGGADTLRMLDPRGRPIEWAERMSGPTLEDTYWKLTELGGRPARVADNASEPHLLLHPAGRRVEGGTGCNRFGGGYELSGDSLRIGPLITTRRACVDPALNRQEAAFLRALARVRAWKIGGDTLVLAAEGGPLARFAAVYLR